MLSLSPPLHSLSILQALGQCVVGLVILSCSVSAELVNRYSFDGAGRTARDSVGSAHGELHGGARLNGRGVLLLDGNEGWVTLPPRGSD